MNLSLISSLCPLYFYCSFVLVLYAAQDCVFVKSIELRFLDVMCLKKQPLRNVRFKVYFQVIELAPKHSSVTQQIDEKKIKS